MRQGAIMCVGGLAFAMALGSTSCRKVINEQQARAIADSALAAYAERAHMKPTDFDLVQFDDSGKVVDWFYAIESNTQRTHVVSVLVDRHGEHEVHHGIDHIADGSTR